MSCLVALPVASVQGEKQAKGDHRGNSPPPLSCQTPPLGESSARQPVPEVPGYELIEELGRGGMGVDFKARQIKANRLVALKMILSRDPDLDCLRGFDGFKHWLEGLRQARKAS